MHLFRKRTQEARAIAIDTGSVKSRAMMLPALAKPL